MKRKKSIKGYKKTGEQKEARRRMNRARRYWQQIPLFAVEEMQKIYPGYSDRDFREDLRRRTPLKKAKKKSHVHRYGRSQKIEELITAYRQTGNLSLAVIANKLRQKLTKPYNLIIHISGEAREHTYPATIGYKSVLQFYASAKKCCSWEAFDKLEKEFLRYAHVS